jgi:rare lipoprotein A
VAAGAIPGVCALKGASPQAGKNYRIQVGAYVQPVHAVEAFEKLKKAGLNPSYERYNEFYRVVLAGVNYSQVPVTAERLGAAGFSTALIKEE